MSRKTASQHRNTDSETHSTITQELTTTKWDFRHDAGLNIPISADASDSLAGSSNDHMIRGALMDAPVLPPPDEIKDVSTPQRYPSP